MPGNQKRSCRFHSPQNCEHSKVYLLLSIAFYECNRLRYTAKYNLKFFHKPSHLVKRSAEAKYFYLITIVRSNFALKVNDMIISWCLRRSFDWRLLLPLHFVLKREKTLKFFFLISVYKKEKKDNKFDDYDNYDMGGDAQPPSDPAPRVNT